MGDVAGVALLERRQRLFRRKRRGRPVGGVAVVPPALPKAIAIRPAAPSLRASRRPISPAWQVSHIGFLPALS